MTLSKVFKTFLFYGKDFIKACVCDPTLKSCMSFNCDLWNNEFKINFLLNLNFKIKANLLSGMSRKRMITDVLKKLKKESHFLC